MSYMTADSVYAWYYDEPEPKRIIGIEPACSAVLSAWTIYRKAKRGAVPSAEHGAKLLVCFI